MLGMLTTAYCQLVLHNCLWRRQRQLQLFSSLSIHSELIFKVQTTISAAANLKSKLCLGKMMRTNGGAKELFGLNFRTTDNLRNLIHVELNSKYQSLFYDFHETFRVICRLLRVPG